MKRALAICFASSAAWFVSTPALAQGMAQGATAAPEQVIGDIIVTAQRRSERAQSTPLAITAVGGKDLQSSGVISLDALTKGIPNVSFGGNGADAKVFIRGVGYDSISPGGETRVAIYSNNVYQSRSQSAFTTLYDIDRIEVLRGPQGTLYGRNAVAGAINIITADPGTQLNGYISGKVGNYSLIQTEGAVGGPVNEWLSVRLAGQTVDRGGYGHNIGTGEPVNDTHTRSARLTLKANLADNVTDRLVADYFNERDHNFGYRYLGAGFTPAEVAQVVAAGGNAASYVPAPLGGIATSIQDVAGYGPYNHLQAYGVSNELSVNVSDLLTITSVSGYRHLDTLIRQDLYGGTKYVAIQSTIEKSDSYTQELRLSGDSGPLKYVLGGYYFYENHLTDARAPFNALTFGGADAFVQFYNAGGREKTKAYAAFGQVDYKLFDALTLSAGLRYSHEKKNLNEFVSLRAFAPYDNSLPVEPLILSPSTYPAYTNIPGFDYIAYKSQTASYNSVDPRFTLSYAFTPKVIAYATYSQGFKSGGFNIGGTQAAFNPERIKDYEAGVKGDFLDGRLRANVAAFYYDYTNLQVNQTKGLALQTVNAATAKVKGVEAEITALPATNLRISLNAAWLDATYTEFDSADPARPELGVLHLKGNRLNYAPKYKVGSSVGYTIPTPYGDFTPTADVTWTDKVYFTPFNTSRLSQPAYTNLDLFIRWVGKNPEWSGSIFVRNATNKIYLVGAGLNNPLLKYNREGQVSAPRTFGAQLTRRF
jgi:iron complex outermembrane receptor protein